MNKKQVKICERLGWLVDRCDNGEVELRNCSPTGEDLNFTVDAKGFAENVAECASNFDVDEHVEMWVAAKHGGTSGIPSVTELVEDAKAIAGMLNELAAALN